MKLDLTTSRKEKKEFEKVSRMSSYLSLNYRKVQDIGDFFDMAEECYAIATGKKFRIRKINN